jgi:hypothetical protein
VNDHSPTFPFLFLAAAGVISLAFWQVGRMLRPKVFPPQKAAGTNDGVSGDGQD